MRGVLCDARGCQRQASHLNPMRCFLSLDHKSSFLAASAFLIS